jgi:hypothetical protein
LLVIPHLSNLICISLDQLIEEADVIVIGHKNEVAKSALTRVNQRHMVIDLVGVCNNELPGAGEYYGFCW